MHYQHSFDEIKEIQNDYKRRLLLKNIMAPTVSIIIHASLFTALLIFVVSQTVQNQPPLVITIKPEETIKAVDEHIAVPPLNHDQIQDPENNTFADSPSEDIPETNEIEVSTEVEISDIQAFDIELPSHHKLNVNQSFLASRSQSEALAPTAVNTAINKGLKWLASRQHPDGNFFRGGAHPYAIWGASTLAFLGNGNSTSEGKYSNVVKKSLDTLIAHQRKQGPLKGGIGWHSYASPFVAMAILDATAVEPDNKTLREAAQNTLAYILNTQQNNGAWSGGVAPAPKDSKTADISATAWWTMALISARLAGLEVPDEAFKKSINYLMIA